MTQTFDQQYTKARAQMEGGDWKLRAEIADLQAENAKLKAGLELALEWIELDHPGGSFAATKISAMLADDLNRDLDFIARAVAGAVKVE